MVWSDTMRGRSLDVHMSIYMDIRNIHIHAWVTCPYRLDLLADVGIVLGVTLLHDLLHTTLW